MGDGPFRRSDAEEGNDESPEDSPQDGHQSVVTGLGRVTLPNGPEALYGAYRESEKVHDGHAPIELGESWERVNWRGPERPLSSQRGLYPKASDRRWGDSGLFGSDGLDVGVLIVI